MPPSATPVLDYAHLLLTTDEAEIGASEKEVVWTWRKATLYRYASERRTHDLPILLVFALINRPDIFDLRPGGSLVEFLLEEGFDVFLLDWGVPGDEDHDLGFEFYVAQALPAAVRETLRASGADELSLAGWCMGGTMCAMYAAREEDPPVRNLVLLTTPITSTESTYRTWLRSLDVERLADQAGTVPGRAIDWANKTLKPVQNWWTTYRRLWSDVLAGKASAAKYQPMAKWVGDNPPFPGRALQQWVRWLYQSDDFAEGRVEIAGTRIDLRNVDQNLLVITARGDHIAPRNDTTPLLDLVGSDDVTHFDKPGGHIGLAAGSKAKHELWPDLAAWLADRSNA
jgi:polyhydroxyalkanoate synthase